MTPLEYLRNYIGHDPRRATCPLCMASMDLAIYGETRESPEEAAARMDSLCNEHMAFAREIMARAVRETRLRRLGEMSVGAPMGTCQVHDADDIVPGRICGRPLPCEEHK